MRKLLLFLLLAICSIPQQARAQKYGCVNSEYILHSIPDYQTAMAKLAKFTEEWQKELEAKQQEVDELREQYQQEAYLLPDNLKQRRQDEIKTKDTELRALQRQRFGAGGDLDKKRAELLRPVQERLYNAIERVAREKNYAFVFDKSAGTTVIYVSEKYDISKQVMEILGVKVGSDQGADASAAQGGGKSNPSATPSGSKSPSNSGVNKEEKQSVKR